MSEQYAYLIYTLLLLHLLWLTCLEIVSEDVSHNDHMQQSLNLHESTGWQQEGRRGEGGSIPMATTGTTANITSVSFHDNANKITNEPTHDTDKYISTNNTNTHTNTYCTTQYVPIICTILRIKIDIFTVTAFCITCVSEESRLHTKHQYTQRASFLLSLPLYFIKEISPLCRSVCSLLPRIPC